MYEWQQSVQQVDVNTAGLRVSTLCLKCLVGKAHQTMGDGLGLSELPRRALLTNSFDRMRTTGSCVGFGNSGMKLQKAHVIR